MAEARKSRRYRVNQIRTLQAEGKSLKEIAEIIGMTYKTVLDYNSDPTGTRRRGYLRNMHNKCEVCGNQCFYKAVLCRDCYMARRQQQKRWTRETIIVSLQTFAKNWGRPPVWSDTLAYPDELPNGRLVWREFGSWANAIEAAGFPRPKRGGHRGK